MISVGVESGSDKTLKKAQKGITVDQIRESRRILKDNFIAYSAYIMIGFPWESKEDIAEVLDFVEKMDFEFYRTFVVTTFPGTQLYELYKNEAKEMDWKYYFLQRPEFCSNKNVTKEEFSDFIKIVEKGFRRSIAIKSKGEVC